MQHREYDWGDIGRARDATRPGVEEREESRRGEEVGSRRGGEVEKRRGGEEERWKGGEK